MIEDSYMGFPRIAERFANADLDIAQEVESGTMHAGTALATLNLVADALSEGERDLRDHLIPELTEAAAARLAKGKA